VKETASFAQCFRIPISKDDEKQRIRRRRAEVKPVSAG
jgi:hypothetical protein